MRLAVIALVIIVMASAIALAFSYAHRPSYAAPNHAKQKLDANGNAVVRAAKACRFLLRPSRPNAPRAVAKKMSALPRKQTFRPADQCSLSAKSGHRRQLTRNARLLRSAV